MTSTTDEMILFVFYDNYKEVTFLKLLFTIGVATVPTKLESNANEIRGIPSHIFWSLILYNPPTLFHDILK